MKSAYTVQITDSENGNLVGSYDSIAEADAVLQGEANRCAGRGGYTKTWYTLTHTLTGDTYEGRIDVTSATDPRFAGKALSIVSTIESRARYLLASKEWAFTLTDDHRASLALWVERLTGKRAA